MNLRRKANKRPTTNVHPFAIALHRREIWNRCKYGYSDLTKRFYGGFEGNGFCSKSRVILQTDRTLYEIPDKPYNSNTYVYNWHDYFESSGRGTRAARSIDTSVESRMRSRMYDPLIGTKGRKSFQVIELICETETREQIKPRINGKNATKTKCI